MDITTVTEKGQATIPMKFRKALGIKPRDRILFEQNDDGALILRPMPAAFDEWGAIISKTLDEELSCPADEDAFGDL